MKNDVAASLRQIMDSSELLAAIASCRRKDSKSRLFGDAVRSLVKSEIETLEKHGNNSEDWTKISVCQEFKTDNIFNSFFSGKCVLGGFDKKDPAPEFHAAPGIYNSSIGNSEIGGNCLIWNSVVSDYLIKENSIVSCAGSLSCTGETAFGNGNMLSIGIETGGRELLSFAEISMDIAEAVCTRTNDVILSAYYKKFIQEYSARCKLDKGIIESGCRIKNTAIVRNSYLGKNVEINSAQLVDNSTLIGATGETVEISHGAILRNSCVQRGCCVSSMAIVDESILLEHSGVERHGKVTHSLIGPNTEIAEGEVTSAFVGPFVGFHHQALLIAAMWPEGKGNVGYGANIGSNHTGKAPDQEIWCGEGTFFGLGVNIKFPSNFTEAPYSVFATGIITLPQRIEFPFSLINTPSMRFTDITPAFNEILPGWTLYENIYMIKRNEEKFYRRDKTEGRNFEFKVFRPRIIDLMVSARNRLDDVEEIRDVYTSVDIKGLGKNFMTEKSRKKGIAAYSFYIEYYCLCGLYDRLKKIKGEMSPEKYTALYTLASTDETWEHQRNILNKEGFTKKGIVDNLRQLAGLEEKMAESTLRSREKDELRGEKIIPDYSQTHVKVVDDAFVKETMAVAKKKKLDIEELMKEI
jgi:carbonic anhydrase/acetyltransferase-like protein (isoleucine patch superfamily)